MSGKRGETLFQPGELRAHLRAGRLANSGAVRGPPAQGVILFPAIDIRGGRAVRLTQVEPVIDNLDGTPVLRVRWAAADALPFSFCLSKMGPPPDCKWLDPISVARGNVILADHGGTQPDDDLGTVDREDPDYRCRCVGVLDEISVPATLFPDLDEDTFRGREGTIYGLYQARYGISVIRISERLSAQHAPAHAAQLDVCHVQAVFLCVRQAASRTARSEGDSLLQSTPWSQ